MAPEITAARLKQQLEHLDPEDRPLLINTLRRLIGDPHFLLPTESARRMIFARFGNDVEDVTNQLVSRAAVHIVRETFNQEYQPGKDPLNDTRRQVIFGMLYPYTQEDLGAALPLISPQDSTE